MTSNAYKLGGDKDVVSGDGGDGAFIYERGDDLNLYPITRGETSLVGHWTFDDGSGTVANDSSGNGNHGTLTSGPTWRSGTDCKVGGCLEFDGVNDYVTVAHDAVLNMGTNDFTITVWAESDTYSNAGGLISKGMYWTDGPGYVITNISSPQEPRFKVHDGTVDANERFLSGSTYDWTFFVAVKRGSTLETYRNGAFERNEPSTVGSVDNSDALTFGKNTNNEYSGFLDDIRIYNKALSAAEIQAIYDATR